MVCLKWQCSEQMSSAEWAIEGDCGRRSAARVGSGKGGRPGARSDVEWFRLQVVVSLS